MADYGHRETDKRLEVMEKRISKVYADTLEEAKTKLTAVLKEFQEEDKKRAQLVADGKLKQRAYVAWRQELLGKAKHLQDMIDVLTEDFTNADKIAMNIVSGEATGVYALNANYAAYEIEQKAGINLSWTLYDHSTVERLISEEPDLLPLPSVNIPLDQQWNKKHITAAINRGILLGDPIPDIAQRLLNVANMDLNAAIRSARTATTAAECAGRINAYKQAAAMGIKLKQMWRATLDGKTRHAHRLLDGQMVDIGEKFKVDGYELEYPGDPSAPGYLVYNCRCTVVSVDKFHDPNAPRASKLGNLSYEEWKAGKEVNATNKWGTYSRNSQNSIENSAKSGKMNVGIQFFANKGITKQSDRQLEKSISSWKANIDRHLEKVKNPEIYDAGWSSKDERQKTGLINHWKKEIRTSENNINDAEAELEKRRNSKNER